jgi:hypothetical protein
MNDEALQLVAKYVPPDDYGSAMLVSKQFQRAMKTVEGPARLYKTLRCMHPLDEVFLTKREILRILPELFDDTRIGRRYHERYIRELMTNIRFDGLLTW